MSRKPDFFLNALLGHRRKNPPNNHLEVKFLDGFSHTKAVHTVERTGVGFVIYSMLYNAEDDRMYSAMRPSKPFIQKPISCESTHYTDINGVKDFLLKKHSETFSATVDDDESVEVSVKDSGTDYLIDLTYDRDSTGQKSPCDIKKWCNVFEALFID